MVNRWGAYGAFVAGSTLIVGHVWSYVADATAIAAVLVLAAHLGIFFVLFALYNRLEGSLADAGTALAVVGNGVIGGIVYANIAVVEGALAASALETGMLGMVGLGGVALFTLGLVLLGAVILQHATLPSPLGGMFIASGVLGFAGGFMTEIVFLAGVVIGGLALLWVGSLLNESVADREAIAV